MPHPSDHRDTPSLTFAVIVHVIAVGALALPGCSSDPPEPPPFIARYETERLRIATAFGAELCAENLVLWEAHLDVLEQELGISREFAWLYLYGEDQTDDIRAECPVPEELGQLAGCWDDPVVRSTMGVVSHELVHAWTALTNADPLPILREGIAVRMAGAAQISGGTPLAVPDLLRSDLAGSKYQRAGHLVAWLLETYGAERFMELYAGTARGYTEEQLTAAFTDILGSEPNDVLVTYRDSAKDYYPGVGPHACGQGEWIAWEGDAATWKAHGSCMEGPLYGTEGSPLWQRWSLEVPSLGVYLLDTGYRVAGLTRCLTSPSNDTELVLSDPAIANDWSIDEPFRPSAHYDPQWEWTDYPVELQPGVYDVWVLREDYEDPFLNPFDMILRRL